MAPPSRVLGGAPQGISPFTMVPASTLFASNQEAPDSTLGRCLAPLCREPSTMRIPMPPKQSSLFPLAGAGATTGRKRDDPLARMMRLNQRIKPDYYLDFPIDHICAIRSVANSKLEYGWVDLQALRAEISITEIFDEPLCEQEAYALMDEGPGDCLAFDEWVEHGWSEPEVELWFEDDCIGVFGGCLSVTTSGSSVADLAAKLTRALDPNGDWRSALDVGWR